MHSCAGLLPRVSVAIPRSGAELCLLLVLGMTVQACGAPKELPDARVGRAYEYAVVYQGLVEPVKAEWRGLPDWLTADGPRVHGTPRAVTQQPLEFAVILTGQLGDQLQGQFLLRVRPAIRPLALVKSAIPPLPVGEPISVWFAANGGEGRLNWEARWTARIPGIDVQIDRNAGTCRLAGTATAEGQFQVQVVVRDEAGAEDQHQFHGQARAFAPPLRITTVRLPEATFSCPYVTCFAAEGGRPPYKWKILWQASPPPGLSVTGDEGGIAGTPTHLGEYPFVAILEDAAGTQRQTSGSLTVVAPRCDPFLVQRELPAATVGRAFEATLCAGGLIASTTWTISRAPSWLRWENSGQVACHLSAVPAESGVWNITATLSVTAPARTPSGESMQEIGRASRVFRLHVAPKNVSPLRFVELHPPVAVQNQPYEYGFLTEGGEPPVRFTFSGNLPHSIMTSPKGTIMTRSMPEPGVFGFTVTATSADGQTQKLDPELRIIPAELPTPLTICDVPRVNGLFFEKSALPVPVHGGVPPYTMAIEPCRGMRTLPSDTEGSLAFRLRHPLGAMTRIAVHDSAGQSVTGSVAIRPVIRLEYAALVFCGLLLTYGVHVYSARLRRASEKHQKKR